MVWLLACTSPADTADSVAVVDSPMDTATPDTHAPLPPCPEAMAAVMDGDDVAFCIDKWEVVARGHFGDRDQVSPGTQRSLGLAISASGQVPTVNLSWGQARAFCQATGKRLPTSDEWVDAADGIVGPGGTAYPYGDTFDPDACACLAPDGAPLYDQAQPTGSLPGCESPFGTFDQSGNVFEWTDPGLSFDHDAWFAAHPDVARLDGARLGAQSVSALQLDVAGVDHTSLKAVDGVLQVHAGDGWNWNDGPASGVLRHGDDRLAVEVVPIGDVPGPAWLLERTKDANAPMADKRGGSYYSGTDVACRTDQAFLGHLHDFTGTIGFRCAKDPRPGKGLR